MTIYGADFSHYDAVPDGARMVSEGFAFMTHKAGGDADDAELAAWWKALKPQRAKILLGAYWVLRNTDGSNAADAFLARLDSQCPGWRDGPFILQLDCESWKGGTIPAPTKAQIKECADRLRSKMPKLRPIVYAPEWVYGNGLDGLGYPLWESSYVTGSGFASELYPGDGSTRWDAYSGQTPAILQFTSSAIIAGQTTCDANAYRGTLAELTALLAPGWEQEMAFSKDDLAAMAHTDGVFKAPAGAKNSDGSVNTEWTLETYLINTYAKAASAETHAVAGETAAKQALTTSQQALAAVKALADPAAIAQAVKAVLPADSDDVSQEEVTRAMETVFAKAFGPVETA